MTFHYPILDLRKGLKGFVVTSLTTKRKKSVLSHSVNTEIIIFGDRRFYKYWTAPTKILFWGKYYLLQLLFVKKKDD